MLRTFLEKEGEVGKILRSPDNDIASWRGFVRLDQQGIPEMTELFLVSGERVLSSRQPARDFDRLMQDLQGGHSNHALPPETFVPFFLRFRALRRGLLLHAPDEHPLLRPDQWAGSSFTPPSFEASDEGCVYEFWIFDTGRYEPVHFRVEVDREGHTQFVER